MCVDCNCFSVLLIDWLIGWLHATISVNLNQLLSIKFDFSFFLKLWNLHLLMIDLNYDCHVSYFFLIVETMLLSKAVKQFLYPDIYQDRSSKGLIHWSKMNLNFLYQFVLCSILLFQSIFYFGIWQNATVKIYIYIYEGCSGSSWNLVIKCSNIDIRHSHFGISQVDINKLAPHS